MDKTGASPLRVYLSGPLFGHASLLVNAVLARCLGERSAGRYVAVLPQDLGQSGMTAKEVRDANLRALMDSNLVLFDFDGTELDSGTVVEFVFAKVLDVPAVILRTDVRQAGEHFQDADPWNLMCSFYPRTRVVSVNAMEAYAVGRKAGLVPDEAALQAMEQSMGLVVDSLDAVWKEPALLAPGSERQRLIYEWALAFPGCTIPGAREPAEFVRQLLAARGTRPDGRPETAQ